MSVSQEHHTQRTIKHQVLLRQLEWNRTNVLLRLFANPAKALFYGVLEQTKQNGLMQFLVSFWDKKAQISPNGMGVFR